MKWGDGDIFRVSLFDGRVCFGQVLDFQMPNIIRVLFFEGAFDLEYSKTLSLDQISQNTIFSKIATEKHFINKGKWPIIGNAPISIPISEYPNEKFRKHDWVGAIHYTEELVEEFLSAYNGLSPWDDFYKPDYLDQFLVDPSNKPDNLIYSKK